MKTDLNYVHIESSTHCNAKCRMCPHSEIKRHGMMDYELFTSIVDQAMDLGCQAFTLFRLGEPLLFPHLFEWLDYLREKQARVAIYTNGSMLTPEMGDRLKEYKDLYCDFTISFHGADKASYESMMGLDFDLVMGRIKQFMEDNPIPIAIYSLANPDAPPEYSEKFKALWEGVGFAGSGVANFMEWAGNVEGFRTLRDLRDEGCNVVIEPCMRILHEVDVMYDGTVCLCCLDAHGDITFGNLREVSLEEVLDHKLRRYYQERHSAGESEELPLCKHCSTHMRWER